MQKRRFLFNRIERTRYNHWSSAENYCCGEAIRCTSLRDKDIKKQLFMKLRVTSNANGEVASCLLIITETK